GPVGTAARGPADPGAPVRLDRLAIATGRSRITASAAVERGYSVAARLDLAPLAAADVDALVPAARLTTDVRLRARAGGPWRGIRAAARADLGDAGRLDVSTTVDAGATPFAGSGGLDLDALDPGAAVPTPPRAADRRRGAARARTGWRCATPWWPAGRSTASPLPARRRGDAIACVPVPGRPSATSDSPAT